MSTFTFKYSYSQPDLYRSVIPISIKDNLLLATENGKYKQFKLDGINEGITYLKFMIARNNGDSVCSFV